MKPYVTGSSSLEPSQSEQMRERFGVRYLHVQSGDPVLANRKDRRRGYVLSPAGGKVEDARKRGKR